MTTTAYDDQYAPEPCSRQEAIQAMAMDVSPHEWRQGGHMRYCDHLITWGEYVTARHAHEEVWHQAQDELADAWDEDRADAIGQNGNDGIHYPDPQLPKQVRYRDSEGEDWIDEFARTSTPEEFRGAMRFTVGKHVRRVGRKDEELKEVRKMRDYCQRWEAYLMKREGEE